MRKLNILFMGILMVSTALILGGCAYDDFFANDIHDIQQTEEQESTAQAEETSEAVIQEEASEEIPDIYYAYHALDETKQGLYREILKALTDMEESVTLSTVEESLIAPVFTSVMNDHPELFYVEGYQYTAHTMNDVIISIVFEGTYSLTKDEVQELRLQIDESLRTCLSEVPLGEDEYSTIVYLYEYLINNTEYDKNAPNNQNILSVFLQGRSVCQGYAKAMQYLLQCVDMQAMIVTGFTDGERHAWNLVRVNGGYYYLDPTWGDASYSNGSETDDGSYTPPINYDYFLVTTEELTRTHSIEKVVDLPECVSTIDNYFVREGLYFTSYDEDLLSLIFDSDEARTTDYVTIKCSSIEVYNELMHKLIDNQEIFNFISNQGETIAYTSNQYQRILSFWNIFY